MARFSIKDVMWSTLLIAVGTCMLLPLFRVAPEHSLLRSFGLAGCLVLWVGGLATLVAGLLAPFHQVKFGFMRRRTRGNFGLDSNCDDASRLLRPIVWREMTHRVFQRSNSCRACRVWRDTPKPRFVTAHRSEHLRWVSKTRPTLRRDARPQLVLDVWFRDRRSRLSICAWHAGARRPCRQGRWQFRCRRLGRRRFFRRRCLCRRR
jgi:hypothetical protein